MSIATLVTRGYGSFGSIADIVLRGYELANVDANASLATRGYGENGSIADIVLRGYAPANVATKASLASRGYVETGSIAGVVLRNYTIGDAAAQPQPVLPPQLPAISGGGGGWISLEEIRRRERELKQARERIDRKLREDRQERDRLERIVAEALAPKPKKKRRKGKAPRKAARKPAERHLASPEVASAQHRVSALTEQIQASRAEEQRIAGLLAETQAHARAILEQERQQHALALLLLAA